MQMATQHTLSSLGYHIPNAKVHLLSLKVLLNTIGGHALQNDKEIAIVSVQKNVQQVISV
jgi:hypothetical protein